MQISSHRIIIRHRLTKLCKIFFSGIGICSKVDNQFAGVVDVEVVEVLLKEHGKFTTTG